MADLRARRIEREREWLARLVQDNPETLSELACDRDEFRLRLRIAERDHQARIVFPRFFPSVPLEAYLAEPIPHPNVDPNNGFVCLWTKLSVRHTAVEAVRRLRLILAWRIFNLEADHVMQLDQAERARRGDYQQIESAPLRLPEELLLEAAAQAPRPRRTRLTEPG